jgi:hypothetical protein
MQESIHYFKYKSNENTLYEYADDVAPRHLTAALPLDYDTVAAADKFGNIFVTRLPQDVSSQVCCACPAPSHLQFSRSSFAKRSPLCAKACFGWP